jgi:hypothetical protein
MWHKEYRDYKLDESLIKSPVEPSRGIIGCEMHDLNGWGTSLHIPKKKKKGFIASFVTYLFGSSKEEESP